MTQARLDWLKPRSRWIDGRATFTIVWSRTIISIPAHRTTRAIQRLLSALVSVRAWVSVTTHLRVSELSRWNRSKSSRTRSSRVDGLCGTWSSRPPARSVLIASDDRLRRQGTHQASGAGSRGGPLTGAEPSIGGAYGAWFALVSAGAGRREVRVGFGWRWAARGSRWFRLALGGARFALARRGGALHGLRQAPRIQPAQGGDEGRTLALRECRENVPLHRGHDRLALGDLLRARVGDADHTSPPIGARRGAA